MPVEVLKPHEQVIQKKVDQLERMTIRWDAYTKPLLVDGATGTTLPFSPMDNGADLVETSFLASGSGATGAKFSSVTVSGFTSTSIPIFFLIFSAILADLPVLSLK